VGGIPEVIGKENTIAFRKKTDGEPDYCGSEFVGKFSWRVNGLIGSEVHQTLSPEFDWKRTAENELRLIELTLETIE
jgi:hypothetical protein